jgi:hypothetical protein
VIETLPCGRLRARHHACRWNDAQLEFSAHRLNTSGDVRLWALPVAGQAFTSETILVMPGQVVTWRLENDLGNSSLSVY